VARRDLVHERLQHRLWHFARRHALAGGRAGSSPGATTSTR
jgi:hypothetical protein